MRSIRTPRLELALVLLALCSALGQTPGSYVTVQVPASSNPYLAGMPSGTKARVGDQAPAQSPVLVELSLAKALSVSFTAKGAVEHFPSNPPQYDPPQGSTMTSHQGGGEHGISDISAPINSLIGVFLDDERPDRTRAPKSLHLRSAGRDLENLEPQLKQVFYIGSGLTNKRVNRKFLVPKGASRLFLGVMDGFEWNNNVGAFLVTVTVERTDVSTNMFSVDSRISFADWTCLPDRSQCTPDRPVVRELGSGQYHIILPANLEWGASIPTPPGASISIRGATGTVCLDSLSRRTSSCNGPQGSGPPAGPGWDAPEAPAGKLISKSAGGQTHFSVNDRSGAAFQQHEGFFEFDVRVIP